MELIAKRIRYLVKIHPKNRQQIAEDLYISADSLGNYISGRRRPDAVMLRQMAIYFQVSADYLLCISPSKDSDSLPSTIEEQSLLNMFRSMNPAQREYFIHSGYGIINFNFLHKYLPDKDKQ